MRSFLFLSPTKTTTTNEKNTTVGTCIFRLQCLFFCPGILSEKRRGQGREQQLHGAYQRQNLRNANGSRKWRNAAVSKRQDSRGRQIGYLAEKHCGDRCQREIRLSFLHRCLLRFRG